MNVYIYTRYNPSGNVLFVTKFCVKCQRNNYKWVPKVHYLTSQHTNNWARTQYWFEFWFLLRLGWVLSVETNIDKSFCLGMITNTSDPKQFIFWLIHQERQFTLLKKTYQISLLSFVLFLLLLNFQVINIQEGVISA